MSETITGGLIHTGANVQLLVDVEIPVTLATESAKRGHFDEAIAEANSRKEANFRKEAKDTLTEALGVYRKLAESDSDKHLPNVAKTLSNLAFQQGKTDSYKEAIDNYTEALEIYRKLEEIKPVEYWRTLGAAYVNRGKVYSQMGNYDEAIGDFTEAIKINPIDLDAYACRKETYEKNGQHDLAEKEIDNLLKTLFPDET